MKSQALAIVALVLALVALGAALLREPAVERAVAAGADLSGLERRLSVLEERLARLERDDGPRALPAPSVEGAERAPLIDVDALERRWSERLALLEKGLEKALEERLGDLEREREPGRTELEALLRNRARRVPPGPAGDRERQVSEWTERALDPRSTPQEMLRALSGLRGERLADGTDARLPVLPAMIDLAARSEDAAVRENVWRQLSGVTDPSLLQPLLTALAHDPDPGVREEAAETLEDFLPDPLVEQALHHAAQHDSDPRVREQALESLRKR